MTFVFGLQTRGSIWFAADRRLSAPKMKPIDNAIKIALFSNLDGQAIFGYSGLGCTAVGSQPSHWIASTLRQVKCTIEGAVELIAHTAHEQLAPHLTRISDPESRIHTFVINALVDNKPQLYSIEIEGRDAFETRVVHHKHPNSTNPKAFHTPQYFLAGSGRHAIWKDRANWVRPLFRLIKAYNRGNVPANRVSDEIAKICYQAHVQTPDGSVGPRCVVVWRNAKSRFHKLGSAQNFYTDEKRVQGDASIPSISSGIDDNLLVKALLDVQIPYFDRFYAALARGETPKPETASGDEIQESIGKYIWERDPKLR